MTTGALSAHIGYLFTDAPLPERLARAKSAGFDAVEHPSPFEIPAIQLRKLLDMSGLSLCQITSGLGNAGEKGIAALPGRQEEFRESFKRALDYAEEAGAAFIHAMSGSPLAEAQGSRAQDVYLENIAAVLEMCKSRRPQPMIEVISQAVVPGYHMSDFDASFDLVAQFPNVRLLVDTYHAAVEGLDPVSIIRRAGPHLGHMHFADHPGRHEPLTGILNFPAITAALCDVKFAGALGFEYIPSGPDHMGWLPDFHHDPSIVSLRSNSIGGDNVHIS